MTDAPTQSVLQLAARPDIFRRSLKVAAVVGTLLALINHGDKLVQLTVDSEALIKILLTYLVPFAVSTWASVQTARAANSGNNG